MALSLNIDIAARFAQFSDALNRIQRDTEKHAKSMETAFSRVNSTLGKIGVGISVVGFARAVLAETSKLERSQAQLAATLRATGHAAGLTGNDLEALADKASKLTLFDNDDVRQAEVALLRFRNIQGATFKEALDVTLRLAEAQGGTATAAAESLGRALEDPVNGLKALRAFMTPLTTAQKDLVEQFERTGDKAGSARIILENLRKSLGESGTDGISGAANRASKSYQDFLQTIGTSKAAQDTTSSFFKFLSQSLIDIDNIIASRNLLDKLKGIALFAAGFRGFNLESAKPLPDPFKDLSEGVDQFIAKQGAATQRLEQVREAAKRLAEESAKIAAATTKAGLEEGIKSGKQTSEIASAAIEDVYAKGLVSAKNYFGTLAQMARDESAAEIKLADAAIAARKAEKATTPDERASKAADLIKLTAERGRLVEKLAGEESKFDRARTNDSIAFADSITELDARLLESAGEFAKAAALRRTASERLLRSQLETNAPGNVQSLDKLDALESAHDRFSQALGDSDKLLAELARAEREVNNEQINSSLGTIAGLEKVDALRRKALADLAAEIPLLEEQARLSGQPVDLESLAEAKQRLKDLGAASHQVADLSRKMFENAFVDPFVDMVNGIESADQALKSFFTNISQSLLKLAAQDIAKSIFGGIFSGSKTNDDKSIFSLLGSFSGIFGSSGGVGDSKGEVVYRKAEGGILGPAGLMPLERYAAGGVAMRPQLALFGEAGPEAFVPLKGGKIPVALSSLGSGGSRVQAGPSALQMTPQKVETTVNLRINEGAINMTLRDFIESEYARTLATR